MSGLGGKAEEAAPLPSSRESSSSSSSCAGATPGGDGTSGGGAAAAQAAQAALEGRLSSTEEAVRSIERAAAVREAVLRIVCPPEPHPAPRHEGRGPAAAALPAQVPPADVAAAAATLAGGTERDLAAALAGVEALDEFLPDYAAPSSSSSSSSSSPSSRQLFLRCGSGAAAAVAASPPPARPSPPPAVDDDDEGAATCEESEDGEATEPWFVLVGGEAYTTQGVAPGRRELLHTSLTFVASAYDRLRAVGVPRSRIITVCQLEDYLRTPHVRDNAYVRDSTRARCARLLAEGGVDYDYAAVNAGTVAAVLLGHRCDRFPKVVPARSGTVLLAIYSHGDSHPTTAGSAARERQSRSERQEEIARAPDAPAPVPPAVDPFESEWFAHMPYPFAPASLARELLTPVATFAAARPQNYLYVTVLRRVFAEMFARCPERPVICLANFCRSGGAVEFLRRPAARKHSGADRWPLLMLAASQAEHDALVAGLWAPFFDVLTDHLALDPGETGSLRKMVDDVIRRYHEHNVYELSDHVTTFAFPDAFPVLFRTRLNSALVAGPRGSPDDDALRKLQQQFRTGPKKATLWNPMAWRRDEVDLVKAVREARARTAIPVMAHGADAFVEERTVRDIFRCPPRWLKPTLPPATL